MAELRPIGYNVCKVITYIRLWINRVRLAIQLMVSRTGKRSIEHALMYMCPSIRSTCAWFVCFFPIYSGRQVRWMYQPVTQKEGHTGFLIHLPSAVHTFIFLARRIQPFLSLVDREVEFCVLTV